MTDQAMLQQILSAVTDNRGQVNRLELSVKDLANAVLKLSETSVRYEEKLMHLEGGMKREIEQQGEDIKKVTSQIEQLTRNVNELSNSISRMDVTVKFLKKVHDEREDSKKWLWRETIGKLIWPAMLLFAVGLLLVTKKFGI